MTPLEAVEKEPAESNATPSRRLRVQPFCRTCDKKVAIPRRSSPHQGPRRRFEKPRADGAYFAEADGFAGRGGVRA